MSLDSSSVWYIIDLALTNLSILGSILMSYFCLLLLRNSPSVHVKIVLLIAISDFFFALANIMSNFEKPEGVGLLCQTEAILRQTGFFLTIYFAAVGGVFAQKISKFRTEECKNKFLNKSIALGLFISVITLLGLVFASKYIAIEQGPLSCQIGYTPSSTMTERLVFLILYEGIAITVGSLLTFRAYIHVIREIKSLPKELVSSLNIKAYSLLWYPAVLFGSFLPCMIASFYRVTRPDGEEVPSWVIGLHIVMPHSIGFTNALVYGIQRKLYAKSFTKDERKTIDTTGRGEEGEEDDDEKQLMRQLLRAERLANSESLVN